MRLVIAENKLGTIWKEATMPDFDVYFSICLEIVMDITN
jgi:hypothetical protein